MKELDLLQSDFIDKLIELKYDYAVSLLNLLTDEEYILIVDLNEDLFSPMCRNSSEEYIHQEEVLDKLIDLFTETLSKRIVPDEMSKEDLVNYLKTSLNNLDEGTLRNLVKEVILVLEE